MLHSLIGFTVFVCSGLTAESPLKSFKNFMTENQLNVNFPDGCYTFENNIRKKENTPIK